MKFKDSESSYSISTELRKNFQILAKQSYERLLRKRGPILTTGQDEYTVLIPKELKQFKLMCCICWYFPEDIQALLRLELENRVNWFGPEYNIQLRLLLRSEPETIIYILESSVLGRNSNEVFGNILAYQYIKFDVLEFNRKKPKRLIRHRGYRDHGSLADDSSIGLKEYRKDWSATEEQNYIEEQREALNDAEEILFGFMQ